MVNETCIVAQLGGEFLSTGVIQIRENDLCAFGDELACMGFPTPGRRQTRSGSVLANRVLDPDVHGRELPAQEDLNLSQQ